MVAFLLLVTCLTTTVINAFINIRNLNNDPQFQPLRNDDDDAVAKEEKSYGTFDTDWKQESDIDDQNSSYVTSDESILPPLPSEMESSIAVNTLDVTSKGGNSSTARPSRNFFRDNELVRSSNFTDLFVTEEQGPSRISSSQVSTTDKNPLLQELYRSTESTISYLSREQGGGPSFITRPAPPQKPVLTDSGKWCGVNKHKFNLILAACIAYLGASVLFSYNMYVSDFLGKVVNGGDSSAPEGSAERKAYEEGVSSAAGGLLVYNCSYMVSGAVQSKLLGFLGLKVDFCLAQALMGGAVLAMVLSQQLPVFYVACVLYGFQRSALYTVPFIIAEHYIEEKGLGKKGDSAVGRVMGAVSCMIPFNFCTVFLLSGPLISLTSYESAPLLVASVAAFLASLIFTLYRQG
ncbi:hypothetical protein V1264_018186 [Littorina saxatilis]|uniref:Uncharacterized protein n=3 Tax=Littorina saxatilis TaxID=31220 RepID=A0AAN9GCG5_9CAEN